MSTYDQQAVDYDATRGGTPRPSAAAEALHLRTGSAATDRPALLVRDCAALGLELAAATSFVGVGQATGDRPDPVYPVLAFHRS